MYYYIVVILVTLFSFSSILSGNECGRCSTNGCSTNRCGTNGCGIDTSIECDTMDVCFEKIISQRHSGYGFDASRAVDPSLLEKLAQASRFTPSSYNEQPWRFIFCDRTQTPEAYLKALDTLIEENKSWAMNAPILVIVASKSNFTKNQKPNQWDKFDTGSAVMSFCYRATSLGLMTHEIGGFDADKLIQEFSIPDGHDPVVIIAVGYEEQDTNIPSEKKRLDLSKNFFLGEWGTPLSNTGSSLKN